MPSLICAALMLFAAMTAAVDRAPAELRLALIKAHPDLASKTQRAAGLTAESHAEQNSAGLDRLSDAEYQAFERVNDAYQDWLKVQEELESKVRAPRT